MDQGYGWWSNFDYVWVGWGWQGKGWGKSDKGWGPPIHHNNGTCTSFADGHVEYWRWTDPKVIAWGRYWRDSLILGSYQPNPPSTLSESPTMPFPELNNPDYVRLHTAIWGKGPQ